MDGYQARFASALHERIEKIILEKDKTLSTVVAGDYSAYMKRVGFIEGLRSVLSEMKEVETSLSTPEQTPAPRLQTKRYEA